MTKVILKSLAITIGIILIISIIGAISFVIEKYFGLIGELVITAVFLFCSVFCVIYGEGE